MARKVLLGKVARLFPLLAVGGLVSVLVACGSAGSASATTRPSVPVKVQITAGPNPSFSYDVVSRNYLRDWQLAIPDLEDYQNRPDYSLLGVSERVRSIYQQAGLQRWYSAALARFVHGILQAANESNIDNILAWADPSGTTLRKSEEFRLVYLEGGPIGDVCMKSVFDVSYQDRYARDYVVNQGQYGFVPEQAVKDKGEPASENGYFKAVRASSPLVIELKKASFDAGTMSNLDYLRLIGGDFSWTDDQVLGASSLAMSILTADRTAILIEYLSKITTDVFLVGESYGMHAGLETFLQHPEALRLVKRAELGRNVLVPAALKPKTSLELDEAEPIVQTVSVGDVVLIRSVREFSEKYGYIDRLTSAFKQDEQTDEPTETFLSLMRSKVEFGFSKHDVTIGPLPEQDKLFYEKNKLRLNLVEGDHNYWDGNQFRRLIGVDWPLYTFYREQLPSTVELQQSCKASSVEVD